jgi:hypothetical protein
MICEMEFSSLHGTAAAIAFVHGLTWMHVIPAGSVWDWH